MRKLAILAAVLCLSAPAVAAAASATWELDTAHTGVHFQVRHLMVSTVRGDFEKVSGVIVYDDADITKSRADIVIDAASINTRVAKRDEHLRSADFLDAAKHPAITFKSKRVEKAINGILIMTGDLTIRGVTKEVALIVEGPSPAIKDPQGASRVGGQATARIDRKDFGLVWNKVLEAGGVAVGDEVSITIDVELVRKAI
ncbi:MAG: YceI family protein [Thermodesulfobacteriota bacterium]